MASDGGQVLEINLTQLTDCKTIENGRNTLIDYQQTDTGTRATLAVIDGQIGPGIQAFFSCDYQQKSTKFYVINPSQLYHQAPLFSYEGPFDFSWQPTFYPPNPHALIWRSIAAHIVEN